MVLKTIFDGRNMMRVYRDIRSIASHSVWISSGIGGAAIVDRYDCSPKSDLEVPLFDSYREISNLGNCEKRDGRNHSHR
jgi:hypothetical protein